MGISALEFWEMTVYEVRLSVAAHNWRQREREAELRYQRKTAIAGAWLNAKLARAKKVPGLMSLLASTSAPQKLSEKEKVVRVTDFGRAAEAVARMNSTKGGGKAGAED